MACKIKQIADTMGAQIVGKVPDTGGGAFGGAPSSQVVDHPRKRHKPSHGIRPGRPTSKDWCLHSKVPMTPGTRTKLRRLADQMSTTERKVSPMQVAAQLIEEALAGVAEV
jgi:hypothetical protein